MSCYIYKVTSPSGKSYIGQTRDTIQNRWRDHLYDAFDTKKDHCKLLNRAIRKYGADAFAIECLECCKQEDLDYLEKQHIQGHNTMKPYGYNLKEGGSSSLHTNETKEKISASLKGRSKCEIMKAKLSETKKRLANSDLPQYVCCVRRGDVVVGYRICGHPNQNGTERKIVDSKLTDNDKLTKALDYLKMLDNLPEKMQVKQRTLPKHMQVYKHGYVVKYNSINKYFVSKSKSSEELYDLALEYLNNYQQRVLDQGNS